MGNSASRKAGVLACACMLVAALVALAACSAPQQSSSASASASALSASDTPMLVVPNVVSLTLPDAEKSIVASGFKLGDVKYEASETVPTGNVVSQSPEALTSDAKDKTVSVVVSSGKPAPKKVKVPDVKGLNQSKAEKKLSKAGLIGICAGSEESTAVDPGLAFKQSIEAGTTVTEGTKVTFTIAVAPSTVAVPNVVGMAEADAENALTAARLSCDTISVYDDNVPEGNVVTQSYNAGAEVQAGTTVTVSLSLGPKPVERVVVPSVFTYSWSDAEATMESAGLVARHTGDPSGVVVDQDFDPGTEVAEGTVVTLTLSGPDGHVEVPDLVGMSVSAAENVTDSLGLSLDGDNTGTIVEQMPSPGTSVDPDTTISVKTQSDDEEIVVPSLIGMSADEAADAAEALGLSLDGDVDEDGVIVEQTPDPGTTLSPGDTVSVKMEDED